MAFRLVCNRENFTIHEVVKMPNMYRASDLINETFEYDTCEYIVRSSKIGEQRLLEKDGLWLATNSGEGIVVNDGYFADFSYGRESSRIFLVEDNFSGTVFYCTDIQPLGKRAFGEELFRVRGVSVWGLLAKKRHLGGVYESATFSSIISDILRGNVPFMYMCDPDIGSLRMSGWLPATDDARTNLHKVLFAAGATMVWGRGETMIFQATRPVVDFHEIPKNRTFYTSSNLKSVRRSSISITEHQFYRLDTATEELLYDNTSGSAANEDVVIFDEPHYDYRVDGLTINTSKSGANHATISGRGKLYGKKYTHFQREVTEDISGAGKGEQVRITDQTLVSPLNISTVMQRFVNYYSSAQIRNLEFKESMVEDYDRIGPSRPILFYDRTGETHSGYVTKIEETRTSFWRAKAEVVTDWVPTPAGNDYTNYKIVTSADLSNGRWTVPSDMVGKKAYVVLFSGAQGGQGGYAGTPVGENFSTSTTKDTKIRQTSNSVYLLGGRGTSQRGGAGGAGGKGGTSASRFLSIDIDALASSYNVTFGAGGAGGAGGTCVRTAGFVDTVTEPELGADGADSVFGSYSTETGAAFGGIYANLLTGEIIAQGGEDGIAGGDGGMGGWSAPKRGPFATEAEANADNYTGGLTNGRNGGSVAGYAGGAGMAGHSGFVEEITNDTYIQHGWYAFCGAGGGGGGGAAMGSAGQAGQEGKSGRANWRYSGEDRTYYYYVNSYEEYNHVVTVNGGKGGDGANATIIPSKVLYRGGAGGHGGGGGGGSAMCVGNEFIMNSSNREYNYGSSYGGKGGNGGKGGDGSDGFMIVYY